MRLTDAFIKLREELQLRHIDTDHIQISLTADDFFRVIGELSTETSLSVFDELPAEHFEFLGMRFNIATPPVSDAPPHHEHSDIRPHRPESDR